MPTNDADDQLKPCPFCGRTDALYLLWASEMEGDDWDDSNNDCCQIVCDASTDGGKGGCGGSSGFKPTEAEAIAAWNTRPQDAEAVVIDGPSNDREALLYLMRAFDTESWQCPKCGHDEDTATMDSAYFLRDYLRDYPRATDEDVRKTFYDTMERVLRSHRLQYAHDEDGENYPLIDALSLGSPDVSTGIEEITLMCDAVYNELDAAIGMGREGSCSGT